ncbi:unnamed protein product [Boreogadus saida]
MKRLIAGVRGTEGSRPPTVISVDAWPELNVIVCRTQTENKSAPKERVSFFCMDEQILSTILKEDDVVDWTASLSFAGIDNSYSPLLKDISSQRGSSFRSQCNTRLLHLTDFDSLLPTEHSEDHFRISSLNDSHVEGKGYAKALVSCMARKLHAQGFPVYCFVEEENAVSYKLFKNLGFVEDPSYSAAWWDCNF